MPQPKSELPTTPEGLEALIVDMLDTALGMELGLSEDDSEYDLHYITQKLARVGNYQERLSDMGLTLAKVGLEVHRIATTKASALNYKQAQLKGSPEYSATPRAERAEWLSNQLEEARADSEKWAILKSAVSTVKEAVADRAGAMKRLDSDLRLHHRILETKVASGASSPYSFKGGSGDEVDLT